MKNDNNILEKFSKNERSYLKEKQGKCIENSKVCRDMTMDFLALYRVDEVTFEDKAPRKEALENVVSSMNIEGVNFVYIIMGNSTGVNFYYGVAHDFSYSGQSELEIAEVGENILKPSLQGNFRGSVITEIDANERKKILSEIDSFAESKILEGVPGINKDDEKFQSVDRMIDVMLGDTFALMIVAKPIPKEQIDTIQGNMYQLYDQVAPYSKESIQKSSGENESDSSSTSHGEAKATGNSDSESKSFSENKNTGHSTQKQSGDVTKSDTGSNGTSTTKQNTNGNSYTKTLTDSNTESKQKGRSNGIAYTSDIINKRIQDWIKYMDDIVFPRIDYGLGKGLFVTSMLLLGETPSTLIKLENTMSSIYGGESGNHMPLKAYEIEQGETFMLKRMQIPNINFEEKIEQDEINIRMACSQLYVDHNEVMLGNWMSSQEISLLAGLPQKEVVGLALKEEVEFGLNINNKIEKPILFGHLVQSGVVLNGENGVPNIPVYFDKKYFDKHIFVTGVTGGGKTTTCQKLLIESKENFLVIEPAKTEYRILAKDDVQDMIVFTLGKETGAPFRLNPFEFFEGESITSRVDMIKASMEAAFDMEAAIPQLLETAIYECYEDKGWNISNNRNYKFDNPFADGVYSFPTLGDLDKKIEKVVIDQGFDDRLRDEYIGSMRARLKGLTVGAKGLMLNTPRSIDFVELLDKKVVLEIENIKSAAEKSLIMGFILANLSEAIKVKYNSNQKKPIEHITLIEEAHRLLSKYMPGDSLNKKQGVEMFSDMLAEVRKYGESLIIADQIPNKLTPDVLKNTNTKIVHKIFAQDDKEAIGNTMALKDEQKEHLSYLTTGRAIMMTPGLSKAIQVQVIQTKENDTERPPIEDDYLRKKIIKYYCSIYKKGILPGLENLSTKPTEEIVKMYLDYLQPSSQIVKEYYECVHSKKITESLIKDIKFLKNNYDLKIVAKILCSFCHKKDDLLEYPKIYSYVEELLNEISKSKKEYQVDKYVHYRILDDTLVKGGF